MPKARIEFTEEQREEYAKIIGRIKNIDPKNHIVGYYIDELQTRVNHKYQGFGGQDLADQLRDYPVSAMTRLISWVDKRDEDKLKKGSPNFGSRSGEADKAKKLGKLKGGGAQGGGDYLGP